MTRRQKAFGVLSAAAFAAYGLYFVFGAILGFHYRDTFDNAWRRFFGGPIILYPQDATVLGFPFRTVSSVFALICGAVLVLAAVLVILRFRAYVEAWAGMFAWLKARLRSGGLARACSRPGAARRNLFE